MAEQLFLRIDMLPEIGPHERPILPDTIRTTNCDGAGSTKSRSSRSERGGDGTAVRELCREHGITDQTIYRWNAKYGGLELSDAWRSRNCRLKHFEGGSGPRQS